MAKTSNSERAKQPQRRAAPAKKPSPASEDAIIARLRGHLEFLRLTNTRNNLDELLAWARKNRPGPTALIEHVLGAEVATKRDARIDRRIRNSALVERKTLEAFDWDFQPSLDKDTVVELARLDFVDRGEDVLINGKPGTGKSHILKAIGLRACERGISLRYARCVDLLDDLHAGLADGTYPKRLRAWARPRLLIIDDVGLGHLKKRGDEPTAAHTLYNIIDRRHGRVSTAITSNIELSDWGNYLGDAILTTAILDRIVMNAIRFRIDGPSYRKQVAEERAKQRLTKAAERRARSGKKAP